MQSERLSRNERDWSRTRRHTRIYQRHNYLPLVLQQRFEVEPRSKSGSLLAHSWNSRDHRTPSLAHSSIWHTMCCCRKGLSVCFDTLYHSGYKTTMASLVSVDRHNRLSFGFHRLLLNSHHDLLRSAASSRMPKYNGPASTSR